MQFVSFCLRVYGEERAPFNLSEASVVRALPPEFMSLLRPIYNETGSRRQDVSKLTNHS